MTNNREVDTPDEENTSARESAVEDERCEECAATVDLRGGFAWGFVNGGVINARGRLFFLCRDCWTEPRDRAALFTEWVPPEDERAKEAA